MRIRAAALSLSIVAGHLPHLRGPPAHNLVQSMVEWLVKGPGSRDVLGMPLEPLIQIVLDLS